MTIPWNAGGLRAGKMDGKGKPIVWKIQKCVETIENFAVMGINLTMNQVNNLEFGDWFLKFFDYFSTLFSAFFTNSREQTWIYS
jgi:hypothetical protein